MPWCDDGPCAERSQEGQRQLQKPVAICRNSRGVSRGASTVPAHSRDRIIDLRHTGLFLKLGNKDDLYHFVVRRGPALVDDLNEGED